MHLASHSDACTRMTTTTHPVRGFVTLRFPIVIAIARGPALSFNIVQM